MIHNATLVREKTNLSPVPGINRESDYRRLVLVYGMITDVPWTEDRSDAFDGDAELMQRTVEDGIRHRGETVKTFSYNESTWWVEGTKFDFSSFSEGLFHKVRKFVLYEIIRNDWRAFETIAGHLKRIGRFYRLYRESHPSALFEYIHDSDIISFIEGREDIMLSGKCNMVSSLLEFYCFVGKNYRGEPSPVDKKALEAFRTMLLRRHSRSREKGHYPTVPDRLFYEMHFTMLELMRNPSTPFDDAVTSCMVLLHMWTGLRPKEVRGLRRRCLVERQEEGKTLLFYEYTSSKAGNRVQSFVLFPAAREAIMKLEMLQTRRETVFISDYLVSYWDHQTNTPVSGDEAERAYDRLLGKYMLDSLAKPLPGLGKKPAPNGGDIYRPCLYSFRVHLCTYLIDHGYDDRWVEAHLGHLSESIRGRYYRMREWRRDDVRMKVSNALPVPNAIVRTLTETMRDIAPKPEETLYGTIEADLIKRFKNG